MKAFRQDGAVERLEALYRYRVLDTEPELAFDRITALAGKVFAVPIVLINLIDHDRQWSKACYGCNVKETSLEHSFCKYAIESDEVMVVPDALQDPRFAHNPHVTGEPHIRFYAGAPLKTPDGYNLGALCLIGTEPNTSFGQAQQAQLADFAAIVVDELELRRSSSELVVNEAKLKAVIETISDAIYIKDLKGRYTLINPAGAAVMGCSVEEVLGRRDDELFGPDDGVHIQGVDEQVEATGEPIFHERETTTSGKVFLTNKYPYRSAEGELLGLIGISRDISQSRQAREALARSKALLRAAFDATAEGVLSVDEHGRVTDYNQRYVDMWRVPRELTESGGDGALVQHALKQVKDGDGFLDRVQEASQNPEGETKDEIELRDGRIIERVSLPQRVGERVAGRVWSFRDVTAWRSAEQSLKSLNSELEARVEARTSELERINAQLRYDAFHDPLTGLANRTLFLDRLELVIGRSLTRCEFLVQVRD